MSPNLKLIKKHMFFFFGLIIFFSCKKGRPPSNNFSQSHEIKSQFLASARTLNILVNLKPGFHAYAPGEKIGIPVNLTINKKNNWLPDGPPNLPSGKKKTLLGLGESVVLENKFSITQKLKPNTGSGEAILHLQVCTNKSCDRPRKHVINWRAP